MNGKKKIIHHHDQKTFKKKNQAIAPNILYIKRKEIYLAYISKINLNCEKQILLIQLNKLYEQILLNT